MNKLQLLRVNKTGLRPGSIEIDVNDVPVNLGRGPLLQIMDSKVSRNQAVIDFKDGNWTLTCKKTCFYSDRNDQMKSWRSLVDQGVVEIKDGDSIALLDKDEYAFKVSLIETKPERSLPAWMAKYDRASDEPEKSNVPPASAAAVHQLSDEETEEKGSPSQTHTRSSDYDDDSAGTAPTATNKRPSCVYGDACYRKNPHHRLDEAHPDDDDYVDPSNDDKPECEYGTDCYRKNPQHLRDFKHTTKPRPKRKAKQVADKKKKKAKQKDSDLDDSFIDDEELDSTLDLTSEEEEEWVPEDSD